MCLHTDNIFVIFLGNRLHKIGIYPNKKIIIIANKSFGKNLNKLKDYKTIVVHNPFKFLNNSNDFATFSV